MTAVSNTATRAALRSATANTKTIVNDSVAFYPSSQRMAAKQAAKGDAFAFYPSNGATRIPKKRAESFVTKQHQQQQQTNYTSKYSRSELDAMFAKSRMAAKPAESATRLSTKDSMAFYPAREQGMVVNTTTSAKDASFGFYASNSARTTKTAVKPEQVSRKSSSPKAAEENHLSLYAAGSLAMGFVLQTGRSLARA